VTQRDGRTAGQWWDINEEYVTVPLGAIRGVGSAAFVWAGASKVDADYLFGFHLDKAMQGDHLRGLGLVPRQVRQAKIGNPNLRLKPRLVRTGKATAIVEPGAGSPKLACRYGMALAIKKAKTYGVAVVTVRGPGQSIGQYVRQAAAEGLIGVACVQTKASVAPIGGVQPLLGNGPTAVGIPAGRRDPIVMDMSFTMSSGRGIKHAAVEGRRIPEGILLDEQGEPTTDPSVFADTDGVVSKGTLVPIGGHKGYAMLYVIGLLTSTLADASPAWEIQSANDASGRKKAGTLLMAIDPGAFIPVTRFRKQVDNYIATIAAARRKPGVSEILYPGQRSQALRRACERAGTISIPASHQQGMVDLAKEIGLGGVLSRLK